MQLGMIGLGRMGANMVRRLQKNGHQCVVYDRSPDSVKQLSSEGATGSNIARQIALRAGCPVSVPGMTVNRFCGSSMQASFNAATAIWSGQLDVIAAPDLLALLAHLRGQRVALRLVLG